MNIYVPGDSAGMVIGGVLLGWLLTPLVLAFSIPASMARSYYSSNDTAIVLAFLGIGLAVVGLILLLVDVSQPCAPSATSCASPRPSS